MPAIRERAPMQSKCYDGKHSDRQKALTTTSAVISSIFITSFCQQPSTSLRSCVPRYVPCVSVSQNSAAVRWCGKRTETQYPKPSLLELKLQWPLHLPRRLMRFLTSVFLSARMGPSKRLERQSFLSGVSLAAYDPAGMYWLVNSQMVCYCVCTCAAVGQD